MKIFVFIMAILCFLPNIVSKSVINAHLQTVPKPQNTPMRVPQLPKVNITANATRNATIPIKYNATANATRNGTFPFYNATANVTHNGAFPFYNATANATLNATIPIKYNATANASKNAPVAAKYKGPSKEELQNYAIFVMQVVMETYEALKSQDNLGKEISKDLQKIKAIKKKTMEKDVFEAWQKIAGDKNLNEYLMNAFEKEEEMAQMFLEMLAEKVKKDAKKYDQAFKNGSKKADKLFEKEMALVKEEMAKADTMMADPEKMLGIQAQIEQKLKESWTSGPNEEQILTFIEKEKVEVKELYQKEKAMVKNMLDEQWEKKVKDCLGKHIDEMHKEMPSLFGFANTVLQEVLKKDADPGFQEDVKAIQKIVKKEEDFLKNFDLQFVEFTAKNVESEVDKQVEVMLKELNPKIYLESEQAKEIEVRLKKNLTLAFNESKEYTANDFAKAKQLMDGIHGIVDPAPKWYENNKKKVEKVEAMLVVAVEDDKQREQLMKQYKSIANQEIKEDLIKLEEKAGIPTTNEELASKIYEEIQGIDEKQIVDQSKEYYQEIKDDMNKPKEQKIVGKLLGDMKRPNQPTLPGYFTQQKPPNNQHRSRCYGWPKCQRRYRPFAKKH